MIDRKQQKACWLFNFSIKDDTCAFKHAPTRIVLRSDLPPAQPLQSRGWALKVSGAWEPMLTAAVRCGIFLKVPELKTVLKSLGLPELQKGSGAKQGVKKVDLAQQLVTALFAEASDAEKKRMIQSITNQKYETIKPGEEQGVTHMISCLDTENAQEFKTLAQHARQKVEDEVRKTGRDSAHREFAKAAAKHITEAKQAYERKLQEELSGRPPLPQRVPQGMKRVQDARA